MSGIYLTVFDYFRNCKFSEDKNTLLLDGIIGTIDQINRSNYTNFSFVAISRSNNRIDTLEKEIMNENYSSFIGLEQFISFAKVFKAFDVYIDTTITINPNTKNKLLFVYIRNINRSILKDLYNVLNKNTIRRYTSYSIDLDTIKEIKTLDYNESFSKKIIAKEIVVTNVITKNKFYPIVSYKNIPILIKFTGCQRLDNYPPSYTKRFLMNISFVIDNIENKLDTNGYIQDVNERVIRFDLRDNYNIIL